MLVVFAAALLLTGGPQLSADRSHAEELARAGRTEEAMGLFEQIVEQDPTDVEARLWIARLALRLGRTAEAEARFRSVLQTNPGDIDARIGLGTALTRSGAWAQAIAVLRETEPVAGENADLFSALARAYRRAGDERRALDYYRRARVLAPDDPDVAEGFESVARLYGHSIAFEGFGEGGAPGAEAASGSFAMEVRVVPALRLHGTARLQERSGVTDMLAGGGGLWKLARATTVSVRAVGGSSNVSLPTRDLSGEVMHYAGVFEIGGSIRQLAFDGADVTAASPTLSRDAGGQWRLDARYTYSRSRFDDSGDVTGDHSVMVRPTWRGWRRLSLNGVYAYGIESFEALTVDRIGSLGTTTLAAGVQIRAASLTVVTTTWEHQWRSNQTRIDRFTVAIGQTVP
jgi:hypothetical protein